MKKMKHYMINSEEKCALESWSKRYFLNIPAAREFAGSQK